jgi:serine/threonine-protein kinase
MKMDSVAKTFSRDECTAEAGQRFQAFGREFQLAGMLGNGAIGIVRRAVDLNSDAQVAVKFLAPEVKYIEESSFEDIHARFKREGERGPSLLNDQLVTVYGYVENHGASSFTNGVGPSNPFIVMEYVPGRTLEHYIMRQQPKASFNINVQSLHIACSLASALEYLHDRDLVHRDVKPANVFVSKEPVPNRLSIVKLGDFGVLKWGDFRASLTTGTLTVAGAKGLGTLKYMSPEQALSPKDVGVRSDIYSLGVTMFELLTNQILPSPHHVFNLERLRYQRQGNTMSKLYELGLGMIDAEYEPLFPLIFDMLLRAPKSRPSSRQVSMKLRGILTRAETLIRS